MSKAARLIAILSVFGIGESAAQYSIMLEPASDNTLYESPKDQAGQQFELSNGAGAFLFAGRVGLDGGFRRRRTLVKFDVASAVPFASVVTFAELSLYQSKAAPNSPPASMGLHRVMEPWGEGTSDAFGPEGQGNFAQPGDATWHHRQYPDVEWSTVGGSWLAKPSSTTIVGQEIRHYVWTCSPTLLHDLNSWLSEPSLNFGWAIVGGEAIGFSAHRFNSRENSAQELRPKLRLYVRTFDEIFGAGFEATSECS